MKKQSYLINTLALLAILSFHGLARGQMFAEAVSLTDATYCTANASYQAQFISSVKVGSIFNITLLTPGGYANHTNLWTAMAKGTSYPITVTNGFGFASDQCAIWVDWNQDGDFTDTGEQFTVTGTPGLGPYTATITPPAAALNGATHMRVRLSGSGSFTSCGTTMYGETEDYTIIVGGSVPVNDIGVINIIAPQTGTNIGGNETVSVLVCNFGTVAKTGFPVSYAVNNGTPVTETISASIAAGSTYTYSFTQKANLNGLGVTYALKSYTTLASDTNHYNDTTSRNIFHAWAQNQKVVQGEYFINSDPGVGNGIAITGTYNLVDVTVNMTNLNLPIGSRLYVRFKSQNGKWSFPRSFKRESFLPNINATLANCEYFINTDPGQGNGTPTTIVSGTANINNLNVAVGSNVYVRVKDSYGRWSKPMGIKRGTWFPNLNATLTSAEYFLNSDPGQGNGTSVSVTSGIINLANLNQPVGTKIYVRVKDSFNRWSLPMGITRRGYYSLQGSTLTYAEYFISADPGQGNGTAVSVASGIINLTNLNQPVGTKIYVRVKDSFNRWSQPMGIARQGWYSIQGSILNYAEYFINTDPGNGNGTPLSITGGNVTIPDLNTPVGSKVYIRVKDSYNRWSQPRGIERLGIYTMTGADIQNGEYFINTDPGQGNGTPLTFTGGIANLTNYNLPVGSVAYVRVKDTYNRWSYPRGYKRPGIIDSKGSDLAAVEYFINNDPGQGNGIQLTNTIGAVHIDSLVLHQHDVVYIRAKDSFNRWGPPKAWKYHFKDFQKAEYKIKFASNGTTTLPLLMQLIPPPDNTCGWIGKKDTVAWHTNDTIWTRFQDQDGFYTNWKRGVIAYARGDTTICPGETVILTATGGGSYLWSNGQSGSSIQVFPTVTTKYRVTVFDGSGASSVDTVTVFVNQLPVAGLISGMKDVCAGATVSTYTTTVIPGVTTYIWDLPPGATGSSTSNSISVTYTSLATSGMITVKGANSCGQGQPSSLSVQVNNCAAGPAGIISGPSVVSPGSVSKIYSVEQISNATSYFWTIPQGSSIVSGFNTNSITINYSDTATSGNIQVHGANGCGNGLISPPLFVTVNPLLPSIREVTNVNILNGQAECYAAIQTVSIAGNNTIFTVENGGQANVVAGENIILKATMKVYSGGYFHAWITTDGVFCSVQKSFLVASDNSTLQDVSIVDKKDSEIHVYPNPTTGSFTLEFPDSIPLQTNVSIFGMHGEKILEQKSSLTKRMIFSLDGRQPGIYYIRVVGKSGVKTTKIIKQ